MTITITDRWGNETKNPSLPVLIKTIEDVFLDNALPEISITDGYLYLDINKNGWIYLSNEDGGEHYMKNLEGEKVRQLWKLFHEGQVDDILIEPWIKGIPAFNGDWWIRNNQAEEKLYATFEINITFNAETSLTCAKADAKDACSLCFSLPIESKFADKKCF